MPDAGTEANFTRVSCKCMGKKVMKLQSTGIGVDICAYYVAS